MILCRNVCSWVASYHLEFWFEDTTANTAKSNTIERFSMHGCNKILCMYLILGWTCGVFPGWTGWIYTKRDFHNCGNCGFISCCFQVSRWAEDDGSNMIKPPVFVWFVFCRGNQHIMATRSKLRFSNLFSHWWVGDGWSCYKVQLNQLRKSRKKSRQWNQDIASYWNCDKLDHLKIIYCKQGTFWPFQRPFPHVFCLCS